MITTIKYVRNGVNCSRGDGFLPLTLRELVVGLVLGVGVEVEDALDEMLAEHFWVLLQQPVQQTVFTQAGTGNDRLFMYNT